MIENARRLSCGNCGGKDFAVYDHTPDDRHKPDELHIECLACESVTTVKPTRVRLSLGWGEKSDGILCPLED